MALNDVIARLADQAESMERTCKNPPCSHAWGIRFALAEIEAELDYERGQETTTTERTDS